MPDVSYEIVKTHTGLEALAPAWRELWLQDPYSTPFQRPEWLLPWWRQFGQQDLRVVTIRHADRLIGLLPFYIYTDPHSAQRQLLLLGVGTTDYLNGLFAPTCEIEHIRVALDLLCGDGGWDLLCATQLLPGTPLAAALQRIPSVSAFATESCSRMVASTLEALPQKIRRNAMYYRNRALRHGNLDLRVADASTCGHAFEALVRLHTERWQARGESGVLADPRVLAWHREALPGLAHSGYLRLCTLHLNEDILAVLYSLIDAPGRAERTQYFYLTAYSQAHAELRPGTLLLAYAIDRAAREGVRIIDMLRGDESYKQIWHMERFPTVGFSLSHASHPASAARLAGTFA